MRGDKFITVSLIVLLLILAASGLALAQASTQFDLGCWGVFTNAGGTMTSPTFRVTAAVGQVTAGVVESANTRLRIGYQQDWRTLQPPVVAPSPTRTPGSFSVYLPMINRYVRITRSCVR